MTGFSLEKKLQGPKVLDAIKSEAFICKCAIRHGFNVRKTGGAFKVGFGNTPSQRDERECFSCTVYARVCVPSALHRYMARGRCSETSE